MVGLPPIASDPNRSSPCRANVADPYDQRISASRGTLPGLPRVLDSSTRAWWRLVGRSIDLSAPEHAFLEAPSNAAGTHGDSWMSDLERQSLVVPPSPDHGLFADLAALDGPSFSADAVHPQIRDFYEHSGRWRMDVWSQWSPAFAPGGAVVSTLFGRRVQQLALPLRPLAVSHGMDSDVRAPSRCTFASTRPDIAASDPIRLLAWLACLREGLRPLSGRKPSRKR